jgi:hypothetical protein
MLRCETNVPVGLFDGDKINRVFDVTASSIDVLLKSAVSVSINCAPNDVVISLYNKGILRGDHVIVEVEKRVPKLITSFEPLPRMIFSGAR